MLLIPKNKTLENKIDFKMKFFLILKSVLLICFVTSGQAQKLFLLGGGTSDSNSVVYEALKELSGKQTPRISVVISAAPSLLDGMEAFFLSEPNSLSYQELFKGYGYEPTVIELARDNYQFANSYETALGTKNIQKILASDIVFFNGGDQSRHSRAWIKDDGTDTDILAALRYKWAEGNMVIAGTSAGLAIQSDPTYGDGVSYGYLKYNDMKSCQIGEELSDDREGTNSERYDINGAFMKGFGFLEGVLFDSHFDARGRFGRLAQALPQTGKRLGFGVDENTGISIVNHTYTQVFGVWGVWVMDIDDAIIESEPESYFAAREYTISYLTNGDTYNIADKSVVSAKQPIDSPSFPTPYESSRIFETDEGLRMITDFVDSEASESIGSSKDKNPQFHVRFHRGEGTKGYFQNGLYTVENLKMDINFN